MLTTTQKRSKIVPILSLLFILSAMTVPSFAGKDKGDPVVVVDYALKDNVVYVTVQNLTRKAQTVNVFVDAIVGTMKVRGFTPVSIFPKGTAETVVGFSDVVDNVETVGISETDSPF